MVGETREEATRRDCCGVSCCCCSSERCCCSLCMVNACNCGGVKLPRGLMGEDSKRTLASD